MQTCCPLSPCKGGGRWGADRLKLPGCSCSAPAESDRVSAGDRDLVRDKVNNQTGLDSDKLIKK